MQPPAASRALRSEPRPKGVSSPASPPRSELIFLMRSRYSGVCRRRTSCSVAGRGLSWTRWSSRPLTSTRFRSRRLPSALSMCLSGSTLKPGGITQAAVPVSCHMYSSCQTSPLANSSISLLGARGARGTRGGRDLLRLLGLRRGVRLLLRAQVPVVGAPQDRPQAPRREDGDHGDDEAFRQGSVVADAHQYL